MSLREKYREWKNTWVENHKTANYLAYVWQWVVWHIQRGRGFWNIVIDFIKLQGFLLIFIEIVPEAKPLKDYTLVIVPLLALLFLLNPQFMDYIKWDQKDNEEGNKRNLIMEEIREFMGKTKK